MLYIIGLGLCDEKDITVRGLEAVKSSSRVYLEAYTSILLVNKERLETFYGKEVIVADRDMVEAQAEEILHGADKQDVSLLVVGDPFGATTHIDIVLRARSSGISVRVIHNASIMNAVGACGLQLYNFGQTVSLVFFTDTWKPDSFYDRIRENMGLGLHTLVLLDIKVKEQSEENLARGRKIYEPPRYMSIPQAVSQLLEVESLRSENVLSPRATLAIALSRVGCDTGSDNTQQRIVCGTLEQLSEQSPESFGEPLHSLVIVGKRLHHLEVVYAEEYAAFARVASYCHPPVKEFSTSYRS
ncbi:diphthine synthase isoform b [Pisolithus croceorrhizus]|nr:diphthine synthase isoform b [Pisolithus croceorrhizus]